MNLAQPRVVAILVTISAVGLLFSSSDCGSAEDSTVTLDGGAGAPDAVGTGDSKDSTSCIAGEYVCSGNLRNLCGSSDPPYDCSSENKVCAAGLGCVNCIPNSNSCDPATSEAKYCLSDGSAEIAFACDPLQGMKCSADGGCTGACTPQQVGRTHLGCDFYPTVTANSVWKQWFSFGLVVTNVGASDATLVVTRGADKVLESTLPKGSHSTLELPWVEALKGPDADGEGSVVPPSEGVLALSGAYRLRSNQPVTVVQFSTLSTENSTGLSSGCPDPFQLQKCLSLSNDASLLVPVTSLSRNHTVVGWHAWHLEGQAPVSMPDFIAITTPFDATTVTIHAGKQTKTVALPGGPAPLTPDTEVEYTMKQGDVLQLFTDGSSSKHQWAGSTITATKPVQILMGSPCANIPDDTIACDHLEELVPGTEMLGRDYLVTPPLTPKGVTRHIVRITAASTKDPTTLTFDPPEVHAKITLESLQTLEIDVDKAFQVSSSLPVAVAQFMLGHGGGTAPSDGVGVGDGDPSASVCIPRTRYLKEYAFATPSGFQSLTLNVIAPTGATTKLNSTAIESKTFTPIGSSGFSVARVQLEPDTRYELRGDQPLSAQLYGFGPFTSFMVPLGLDLQTKASP